MKQFLLGVVALIFMLGAYGYYQLYGSNVKSLDDPYLYIKNGSTFPEVLNSLHQMDALKNESSFQMVAKMMKYGDAEVPGGRYKLEAGMSNRALISRLRAAKQDPVDVTFNNVRTIPELAGALVTNIDLDSLGLLNYLYSSENLAALHLDTATLMTAFVPNTYKVYWNTTPEKLINKLAGETKKFWEKENRKEKAQQLGLTFQEVYTLASVVEKESNNKEERPRVAGVYLNRLRDGIKLQADPTVVFASGDFGLRRVLYSHLEIDSPYNTYKYTGLPPGPIYMPSINSIDAVLNAEKHEYQFFCAKPGYNGAHQFAKTLAEHSRNAALYQTWLSSEGIK